MVSPHPAPKAPLQGLCIPPKVRKGLGCPEPLPRWLQTFQRFPHSLHSTNVVMGSSALRVCTWGRAAAGQWRPSGVPQTKVPWGPGLTWLYVQFFFLHLPHWKRSVTVPPVLAIWCSRMASWVMAFRSFFSSSLAISYHQHWPRWVSVTMALLTSKYHSPTPSPSSPKTG